MEMPDHKQKMINDLSQNPDHQEVTLTPSEIHRVQTDSSAKILVVDDDRFIRQIMHRYLKREGFEVELAVNGKEAITVLEEFTPDIIISDWMMPELDGIGLCKWVREQPHLESAYFILLTAKDRVEEKTLGFETGADDYVTKPFQGAELIARVRSGLRLIKAQRELSKAYRILDTDFQVLASLQKSLLPDPLPEMDGYDCAVHYSPSLRAGGDYFDFIKISELHMGILVADVSGHGAAASMVMAIMRVVMRAFVQELLSPGGALTVVNNVLVQHVPTDQFATAFYGILNLKTSTLAYTSAGHNPPLIYRHNEKKVHPLVNTGGIPLKIFPNIRYEETQVDFQQGDHLLLYTDGLTEAFNPEREMLGEEALVQQLEKCGTETSTDLIHSIIKYLNEFAGTEPLHDDVTLVALRKQ